MRPQVVSFSSWSGRVGGGGGAGAGPQTVSPAALTNSTIQYSLCHGVGSVVRYSVEFVARDGDSTEVGVGRVIACSAGKAEKALCSGADTGDDGPNCVIVGAVGPF